MSPVFLDVWLDGQDSGPPYPRGLQLSPNTHAIPVIICTGDRSLVLRVATRLAELATGVLVKPCFRASLSQQIAARLLPRRVPVPALPLPVL